MYDFLFYRPGPIKDLAVFEVKACSIRHARTSDSQVCVLIFNIVMHLFINHVNVFLFRFTFELHQVPRGVVCVNPSSTRTLPVLPDNFSMEMEVVLPQLQYSHMRKV